MGALRATITGIRRLEKVFSYIGIILLLAMMLLGSADVFCRYLFRKPIVGALESTQLMQAGLVFLGWAYAQATKSHIKLDIIYDKFPKKMQKAVDIFVLLLTIVLFAVIMWKSAEIAISDMQQGRLVATLLIPVFPIKFLVPIGSFFLIIESIIQLLEQIIPSLVMDVPTKEGI